MDWYSLTFFGDSMLLLPSGIIVFAILMFVCRDWKQTAQWALLFGGVGAIVCASKLAFMGWGIGIRELDFTGFSGHSALSASIWPVMMWLLTGRFSTAVRKTAVLSGYALALLIGYSRLAIHVHSVSEVISGLALGGGRQQRIFMAAAQYCTASPVIPKNRCRLTASSVVDQQRHDSPDPGTAGVYRRQHRADR